MTILHFTLSIDGLEDDTLVVRSFEGQENFSDGHFHGSACFGFRYQIELANRQERLLAEQIVDRNAELRIYRNEECVQRVHGIVRALTQGDSGYRHNYYSLTLVPALERLSLRHNSRIFQNQTTMDIVSTLLEEMGIQEFAFALRQGKELQPREFCVQYRESDLDFLNRIVAEEGWVYSFEHLKGKHTLLFSNHSTVLPVLEEPVIYNNLSGGVVEVPYISAFSTQTQTEVAKVQLRDYSFKKPAYDFMHSQYDSDIAYQRGSYEHYDYPGRYKDDANGRRFSQVRLDYLRRAAYLGSGNSNQPLLRPGYRFEMAEHTHSELNRRWVVVSVTHKGTQPQALEEEGHQGATTYSNHFHVIPSPKTWRATPQPKPQIDGAMTATVVGPKGEEIFCDKHGRVKVHFPWDRYSKRNENSSCWVRVSQGWAGNEYGSMALPRVGHEVIVAFLNGDPDQPIIIGRTYHARNIPPYRLPENKTKTVLRSETHQGDGFNELSFEDQADAEKIYLHAQKDFETDVLNDHSTHIKHDKHLRVDNSRFTQIKRDNHLTIEGESCTAITGDRTDIVQGKAHQKVGEYAMDSAGEVHIKSGQKVVIEAGAELSIKANGSFVKLDAAGVLIAGAAIGLNSGGSAGSGGGFRGNMPQLPAQLAAAPAAPSPSVLTQAQVMTMKAAAPFCEECEKCKDGQCQI